MSDLAKALLETPLGTQLSAAEATDLASAATKKTLGPSQYLFRAGDAGQALYLILSGSLDVVLGQTVTGENNIVATLGAGQVVGELEVMTETLRVASLLATEETVVLELSKARFDEMLKQNRPAATKLVVTLAKALARRLAAVNQRLITKAVSKAPPPPAPQPLPKEPSEVSAADIIAVDDDDLDVLDKLWS